MNYIEQLKHPSWQKRRLEMLNLRNWACEECGGREQTLHVHHRKYVKGRMAWEYADDELSVLCEDHHKEEHDRRDVLRSMLANKRAHELEQVMGYAFGLMLPRLRGPEDLPVPPGHFRIGFVQALEIDGRYLPPTYHVHRDSVESLIHMRDRDRAACAKARAA